MTVPYKSVSINTSNSVTDAYPHESAVDEDDNDGNYVNFDLIGRGYRRSILHRSFSKSDGSRYPRRSIAQLGRTCVRGLALRSVLKSEQSGFRYQSKDNQRLLCRLCFAMV